MTKEESLKIKEIKSEIQKRLEFQQKVNSFQKKEYKHVPILNYLFPKTRERLGFCKI